jgi:putative ABC transport system ATP-binding protein
MPPPLFSFDGVGLRRDDTDVLVDVTGEVPDAGITVILGASGSGKSSLLRCCNRLDAPTSGTVRFRGDDVAGLDPLAHRKKVAMVFQAPVRFPGTVADNLRAVRSDLDDDAARAALAQVGLDPDLLHRPADALSGGEAQRLVVARALTTDPEVLLADEASSALDAVATSRLEDLARRLAGDGMPILWVTHDLEQARRLADHVLVMDGGRISWCGGPSDPGARPAVEAALGSTREDT